MAQTPPPTITPTPTPAPQRGDRTTFSGRVDLFVTWLVGSATEFGNVAVNVYNNAVDAYNSSVSAAGSATTATTKSSLTAADAIATAADRAQTGLDRTASAASAASAAAVAGAFVGTSTTSLLIALGSKTFATQSGEQYTAGIWMTVVSQANAANWLFGQVLSYSGTTLVIDVQAIGGSGTYADWNLSLTGARGATGPVGPSVDIAATVRAATTKTALSDADEIGINNSAAGFTLGKVTFGIIRSSLLAGINNIGIPGTMGFGVGICPELPSGFEAWSDTKTVGSDHYGNYIYSDGSEMVWIPAFVYKYGTGSNGLSINQVSTKSLTDYANVAAANADGYALHRMFWNAGAIQPGRFVDKYICSNNGGIASSIKLGLPLSSAAVHNPFSGLNGAPANAYYGAIAAVKTRGQNFFVHDRFSGAGLAMLSLAHAQASTSTTYCAWYDSAGITNFPKGCNNNALGDYNDTSLTFVSDGYLNCAKTGSANVLAKTTHNGQNCGIADLNGNMWEIQPGITSDGTNFYLLKKSVDMILVTAGNTLATDLWGAAGIAALYDSIGATYGALTASSTAKTIGSASQVFSEAVSGNAWAAAGAGIPLVGGVGGTNIFGADGLWDYRPSELCPIAGGSWYYGADAGVWALNLSSMRSNSPTSVGCRAALLL